jgi:hypothetical protein
MLMMPKVMFFIGVILSTSTIYAAPAIYTLFTTVMTRVQLPEYARVPTRLLTSSIRRSDWHHFVCGGRCWTGSVESGGILVRSSTCLVRYASRVRRQITRLFEDRFLCCIRLASTGKRSSESWRSRQRRRKLVLDSLAWRSLFAKDARLTKPSL